MESAPTRRMPSDAVASLWLEEPEGPYKFHIFPISAPGTGPGAEIFTHFL